MSVKNVIIDLFHNILKHSKAKNVEVSGKDEGKKTVIRVIDDGVGVVNNTEDKGKGLGLNSMQYRANQIGAAFVIKQNKPNGTCVQLSISNKLLEVRK
jgi:signal transduction histidine kinase